MMVPVIAGLVFKALNNSITYSCVVLFRSEERFGVTTSHITVTYRDSSNQQEEDDDDFLEPLKRPDTSKYQ